MDQIQKTLIQAGRKDLAQKYFKKVTSGKDDTYIDVRVDFETTSFQRWAVNEPDKDKASKLVLAFVKEYWKKGDSPALRKKYKIDQGGPYQTGRGINPKVDNKVKKISIDYIVK